MKKLLLVPVLLTIALAVSAQTTYTFVGGGANNNWSTVANWDANGIPPNTLPAGDFIVITANSNQTNNRTIEGTMTVNAGVTMTSGGALTIASTGTFTNNGMIIRSNNLIIDGNFVNNGTLENNATFRTRMGGTTTNNGDIINNTTTNIVSGGNIFNNNNFNQMGTLNINNGTFNGDLTNDGILFIAGSGNFNGDLTNDGTTGGLGTITGNLINNGTVAPGPNNGTNVGTLTVTGDYTSGAGATLEIEIRNNNNNVAQTDVLSVAGNASLDGQLVVIIANVNDIKTGDSFAPLVSTFESGTFSSEVLPGDPADWTITYSPLVLEYSGPPLPIELLSFGGRQVGAAIQLHWETATERDNDYVEVQRSRDGKYFEALDRVPGAGNSATPLRYTFADVQPLPGVNYYRLRQVDFDGQQEFHPIIAVRFDDKNAPATGITVFPTFVSEDLNIRFAQATENAGTLLVSDLNGRILLQRTLGVGTEQTQVHVSSLPAGHYIVVVQNERTREVSRFVKE